MKTGFIGLGIMGSRMAANLQAAGYDLVVYNRTPEKAQELLDGGATWANSPAEVARQSDILITMLSTPDAVRETSFGENGILAGARKGLIWADSSTVDPFFSREIAGAAKKAGIHFLDAPVAGSKAPAASGELLFLVGGESDDVNQCQPLFDIMGKKTLHLGPAGSGASMKMLVNLLLGQAMLAFSEAIALGNGMGLEEETVMDVLLQTPVTAPFLSLVRPKLENREDRETNFPLKWMQKDLQLAAQTAYETGVPMPSLNIAKEIFAQAKSSGFADRDFSHLFHFLNPDQS